MALPDRSSKKRTYTWQRRWRSSLKAEFDAFLQSGNSFLSPEQSAAILDKLHDSIGKATPVARYGNRLPVWAAGWSRWAAAAVVILMAGAAWRYYYPGKMPVNEVAVVEAWKNAVIMQTNYSDTIRRLTLPDKSVVMLSKGSRISYTASFDTGNRHVHLSGKPIFDVAKNVAKPFIVYAGGINTTVLGTRFMMSTLGKNSVRVKLFSGKVVIRAATGAYGIKDVYLNAGEQFVIDKQLGRYNVTPFGHARDTNSTTLSSTKAATPGKDNGSTALEFNQEPLGKVLARIGRRYNVQFSFSNNSFNTVLVTGKLLPSDSLDMVLSMLGSINSLSFEVHGNNKITVTKTQ